MCRLHNLRILRDVGMNVVHSVEVLTAGIGERRVETTVSISVSSRWTSYASIPCFSGVLKHPVHSRHNDFTLFPFDSFTAG